MIRVALLFSLFTVLLTPSARAAGDPVVGKEIATTWCSACHHMDDAVTAADGARPFAAMARDPKATADRLRAFLVKPHGEMPELHLTRQEIENLVAYIESLK
jgi:mono/diheme cytochrome c family protein